jgi:hypothetical protein
VDLGEEVGWVFPWVEGEGLACHSHRALETHFSLVHKEEAEEVVAWGISSTRMMMPISMLVICQALLMMRDLCVFLHHLVL